MGEIPDWQSSTWYGVACLLNGWGLPGEYGNPLRTADGLEQILQALGVVCIIGVVHQQAAAEAIWLPPCARRDISEAEGAVQRELQV